MNRSHSFQHYARDRESSHELDVIRDGYTPPFEPSEEATARNYAGVREGMQTAINTTA